MPSAHRSLDLSGRIHRAGIYFWQVWEWHEKYCCDVVSVKQFNTQYSLFVKTLFFFFSFLIAQPRVRWVWLNVGFPKTICLYQRRWKTTPFRLEGRRNPGGTGQRLYPVRYRSAAECIWNRAHVCHVVQPETNYSRGPSGLPDQNSNSSKTTPGAV